MRWRTAVAGAVLLAAGCSPETSPPSGSSTAPPPAAPTATTPAATPSSTPSGSPSPSPTPTPTASPRPARFEAARVLRDIETLAVDIGPREATSRRYARAADWVERRFTSLGYRVRRESVRVPAGNSWGVPVRAGRSVNLIAERPGLRGQRRARRRRRPSGHRSAGPRCGGQRVRRRCPAGAGPAGRDGAARGSGALHRFRRRRAARFRGCAAPLRLAAARGGTVPGRAERDRRHDVARPGRGPGRLRPGLSGRT